MSNRRKIKPNARPETIRTYNGYKCNVCQKQWLTVDLNRGVTPMFSPCFGTKGCWGRGESMGYPPGKPPAYLGEPIIEWYQPTDISGLSHEMQDYIMRGGLMRRAAANAPDWVKEIA